jgi:hypothetical protein
MTALQEANTAQGREGIMSLQCCGEQSCIAGRANGIAGLSCELCAATLLNASMALSSNEMQRAFGALTSDTAYESQAISRAKANVL